jgi:hypothetical protein
MRVWLRFQANRSNASTGEAIGISGVRPWPGRERQKVRLREGLSATWLETPPRGDFLYFCRYLVMQNPAPVATQWLHDYKMKKPATE